VAKAKPNTAAEGISICRSSGAAACDGDTKQASRGAAIRVAGIRISAS
tara:strand:- start:250 stop:393 length:144 start_codon:yes stop_codon:yes gene_type:complete